ncbi:MAG: biopolymer transporter ExbD, partial [Pseudomonadota bacterium]
QVIEISIDGQGRYYVNQQRVLDNKATTLKRAMRLVLDKSKDPQLIISADRNTPHQAVITAMDAARQLGLTRLTFATRQSDDKR